MNNKKIMILGASILQLPAILKAKEMGLEVIAVDINMDAIGFKYADVCINISTVNIPKVVEVAKIHEIDGIMTLASDIPMRTVASVAKELNIVGISQETALKATNKALMRQCLKQNNVPIPRFFRVEDYESYLYAVQHFTDKFIVKPAENSGSRGVFLVDDYNNKDNIKYAYQYSKKYSRGGEIIVEEFMEGPEVSVETFCIDGEVKIIAITDKLTSGGPRFVEMGHSQPSQLSDKIKEQIEVVASAAIKAIGIKNGPSHTEIIVTSEGPKIVELGARLGGDNITTHLTPLSTGVDMVDATIRTSINLKPNITQIYNKGSVIRYLNVPSGKIISIKGLREASKIDGVKQVSLLKNVGDTIDDIKSSGDRVGYVITQSENVEKAKSICKSAINRIEIQIDKN